MQDFCTIKEGLYVKYYFNENNERHRLTGPAIEWLNGDKSYDINNIRYMDFYKNYNELLIYPGILKLI